MAFFDGLANRIETHDSILCVGLDPALDRLPEAVADAELPRWAFNRRIIDATHDQVAAYKPNVAFYEDVDGWRALRETIAYIEGKGVPIILDAKRGDIGNTARQYAAHLDLVDAMTVNPYLGRDSLEPFLQRQDKGVFILCRTSNPGGEDIQGLPLDDGDRLYERVAALASMWNVHGNVGLVVGATAPAELETVRGIAPELPFLVPGVGAQGGDMEAAVEFGLADGVGIINTSRSVIFADEGPDFDAAARSAAKRMRRRLNEARSDQ